MCIQTACLGRAGPEIPGDAPHPITKLTPEQMDQRAAEIAPQVVDLLLKGQQAA